MKNLQVFVRYFLGCVSCAVILTLPSCEQANQKRTYEEVVVRDPHQLLQEMIARGEDPHAFMKTHPLPEVVPSTTPFSFGKETPVSWSIPDGWKEKPAGGMRLASFGSDQDPGIDVSIVSLGGMAGGVSANVNRWLKQIHLPSLDEEAFNQFLSKQKKFKTESGLAVTLIDLTMLQAREDNNTQPGMLAAMVEIPGRTVFVKMTGTVEEIDKNREAFRELCESLRVKN